MLWGGSLHVALCPSLLPPCKAEERAVAVRGPATLHNGLAGV